MILIHRSSSSSNTEQWSGTPQDEVPAFTPVFRPNGFTTSGNQGYAITKAGAAWLASNLRREMWFRPVDEFLWNLANAFLEPERTSRKLNAKWSLRWVVHEQQGVPSMLGHDHIWARDEQGVVGRGREAAGAAGGSAQAAGNVPVGGQER